MIDLDDLRSFIEVVASGGFGRAAKRLGMSKSMVSRRISRMEADLGTPLLSRTTRGISPTEAGLELKERGERILAEVDEATEAVAHKGGGIAGRLRLSVPLSFGVRHVAPVLAEIAKKHPRLEMDVSYSDRLADLIGERFDAAIRIGSLKDSSLIARRIGPVRAILVASPDYLAKHGRPKTPDDLANHECLIYTGSYDPNWVFRAGKRVISIRPQGRLRSDSGEAILQWAVEGLGIAFIPTFILSDDIGSGRLEVLLQEFPLGEGGIYVVRPPGNNVPGKVRVLIDTLVERFGGEPVWDRCLMHERHGRRD
jgi:DNA-binding transcriptional LysR family regulator